MRRRLSMTRAWSFDFIGRKRAQLCFSRLDQQSGNDANNEDSESDKGFLHVL